MEKYNSPAKLLHWVVGLAIIGLIAVGLYMEGLDYDGPTGNKMQLYGIHKSIGAIVLILMVIRVTWRMVSTYPNSLSTHQVWEKILSKVVHGILYIMALSMPLSGWAMSSSYGYPVSVFGLFTLPALVDKNEVRGEWLAEIHEIGGYALIAVIILHVLGAIKHHIIDKDETIKRMLPFVK